jgi:predicted AAA+ superfamily ATPase
MKDNFEALEKYNFWQGNVLELGFPREEYTQKIFDYTGNKLIKVLVGQRRAGKSYILRQIANKLIPENLPLCCRGAMLSSKYFLLVFLNTPVLRRKKLPSKLI